MVHFTLQILLSCAVMSSTALAHGFTAVVSGPDMLTGNLDQLTYSAAGGKTPAGNPLTSGMGIRYHDRSHAFVVAHQSEAEKDTPVTGNPANKCGKQNEGGQVDITKGIAALYTAGGNAFPSSAPNGTVYAIWHQVVADGGGILKAQLSNDATGNKFTALNMEIQAPGKNNNYRAPQYKDTNGQGANYTYSFNLPPTTKCTGGPNSDSCLIKVTNNNFGGCFMVTPYGAQSPIVSATAPAQSAANKAVVSSAALSSAGASPTGKKCNPKKKRSRRIAQA